MTAVRGDIVVAGHICLDMIPVINTAKPSLGELLVPGKLLNVGPVTVSTGGAVANTGVALHKLGVPVRLVGKVGADSFGDVILRVLRRAGERLAGHMVVDPGSDTSYTMVISPPGIDRVFLHHPGANDSFTADDVTEQHLAGASLFHFGYPPLMRQFYSEGGAELGKLFARVRAAGIVTSLDMSNPDPESDSGRVDWRVILRRVLPHVDVFLPSLDEIAFMLGMPARLERLHEVSSWLLDCGAAMVAIKIGSDGIYLRTTRDAHRLDSLVMNFGIDASAWTDRELISGCYDVEVIGTTGSGDCTIAGFLAELREGAMPDAVADFATAVGACSVEAPDATGGVPAREVVKARLSKGWRKKCGTGVPPLQS